MCYLLYIIFLKGSEGKRKKKRGRGPGVGGGVGGCASTEVVNSVSLIES